MHYAMHENLLACFASLRFRVMSTAGPARAVVNRIPEDIVNDVELQAAIKAVRMPHGC